MRRKKQNKSHQQDQLIYSVSPSSDYFWHQALLSLLLLSLGPSVGAGKNTALKPVREQKFESRVLTFGLHPTATLAVQKARRLLLSNNSLVPLPNETTADWFHPNSNAVYAAIPKKEDREYFHFDEQLEDFHRYRHLSRFEREYRLGNQLDLHPDWHGIYEFDDDNDDDLFGDEIEDTTTRVANYTIRGQRSLKDSSAHFGGRYNNYQGVSLSQGYGTHYVNAWVGSPEPQRKTLIVDTGSHYTAFPCTGCNNCGLKHHTDPYYNPEQSDSFHVLDCDECREGVSCKDDRCVFSQSYTEGSSWEAYQVRDKFYCGGSDVLGAVDPKDQKYVIDFMFGCQLSLNGLFKTQLADGIAGFSMFETTLVKQMYNQGILEHNVFALCYRRELGSSKRGVSAGAITLGGVSNSLDTSPMIFAKNMASVGFYTVFVKNIYIRANGGQSSMTPPGSQYTIHKIPLNVHRVNSGKGVIVDSGTTDTYLNKNMARSFNVMWKKVTGKDYAHSPISLNDDQLRKLPTILVQCQAYDIRPDPSVQGFGNIVGYAGDLDPSSPNDLLIAIPATNYMEYSPRTKMYASRVYFTETNGGVLGSNTMQGHNVLFDWGNGRIGFAESTCTYDRKEVPKASEEGRYPSDCILGSPILTQSCIETVDQQLCDNNPTNIALLGTETWTMLVEHPGRDNGVPCVEAARKLSPSAKAEDDYSSIDCGGEGLCTEVRPCQISCKELPSAKTVSKVPLLLTETPAEKSNLLVCGDTYWSACDFKCRQTRIESSLFTDGNCHEVHLISRPCHKDACGRLDPCRIPFVVHVIFAFRGVYSSDWSKRDENIFTESVVRTFRVLAPDNPNLFDVGDIKIILVRPWLAGDDVESLASFDDENDELGVKVVAQISIFNSDANSPMRAESPSASPEKDVVSKADLRLRNGTGSLEGAMPPMVCNDSELFTLAKRARLVAYDIPAISGFMTQILGDIISLEGERGAERESAFSPLLREPKLAYKSRLLSSWTIRTDVDDEINYFGPPEPFFFTVLRYVHHIALITFCASLFVFMWGVAVQSIDVLVAAYNTARIWMPWFRGSDPVYQAVVPAPEGSRLVSSFDDKERGMSGVFEKSSIRRRSSIGRDSSSSGNSIELANLKPGNTRNDLLSSHSMHKKRRNSGVEGSEPPPKVWQLSHQLSV